MIQRNIVMKKCLLCSSCNGGFHSFAKSIAKILTKEGHKVVIVSFSEKRFSC